MLRITYRGRKTAFDFTKIKKTDAKKIIASHLRQWGREQVKDEATGKVVRRTLPPDGWEARWQDGDKWDDGNPGEVVPLA